MSHAQNLLKSNRNSSTHEDKWTRYIMQELAATGQCKNPSYHVIYDALKKYGEQDAGIISDLQAILTRQEEALDELRASLGVILDAVDYTAGNCRVTEMVSAVLPKELIEKGREALEADAGEVS